MNERKSGPVGRPEARIVPRIRAGAFTAELRASARDLVERTCRAQGLPVKVTDPLVLRQVATLLDPSHLPGDRNPGRVKDIAPTPGGPDRHRVTERSNDGPLPGRGKAVPLAS